MPYTIHLQTLLDPQPTAVVRHQANQRDLPKLIPQSCGQVWNLIRTHQIKGAGRHIPLYLDTQINLEIGASGWVTSVALRDSFLYCITR